MSTSQPTIITLTNFTGTIAIEPASVPPVPVPPPIPVPSPPVVPPPPISTSPRIAMILMENRSFDSIFGPGRALWPHTNALAAQYAYATHYYGVGHPSLPNYLALICGSHQGLSSDGTPQQVGGPFGDSTLFDSLAKAGISWKAYFENLPSAGYIGGDTGGYTQHHDPLVYFHSLLTAPSQLSNIVSDASFASDLASAIPPSFVFYVPNNQHNGHSNQTNEPDTWLASFVSKVQASAWYQANGTIVVVWDESDKADNSGTGDAQSGGGLTGLVVISEAVKGTGAYATKVNCFGLLGSIETLYGVPQLGNSAHASNGNVDVLLRLKVGA